MTSPRTGSDPPAPLTASQTQAAVQRTQQLATQPAVSGPSSPTGPGPASTSLPAPSNLTFQERVPPVLPPFLSCARHPSRYTASLQCSENVVIFPRNMHNMRNMQI
jgi:hypothetical protein